MVTGASGVVGRAVVKALLATDEVRATVRRPEAAEPLRGLGAKVTVRAGTRADELAEVLPRCHTLVHLVGGVAQPDPDALFAANHGSVLVAIEAARDGRHDADRLPVGARAPTRSTPIRSCARRGWPRRRPGRLRPRVRDPALHARLRPRRAVVHGDRHGALGDAAVRVRARRPGARPRARRRRGARWSPRSTIERRRSRARGDWRGPTC